MRQSLLALLISAIAFNGYGSKLSHFLKKHKEREKARQQRQIQKDMNFADFVFRLEEKYMNQKGEHCRVYISKSRSNPYLHGTYVVCEG